MKLKKILLFLLLIADTAFSTQAFDKYTLDREDLPSPPVNFSMNIFRKLRSA